MSQVSGADPAPVSVIVPSRGPASRLQRLLDSLALQTAELEAIVVDNDSPEREVARLCAGYGFVETIELDRNAGFSEPINIAARQARGDVIVLINDDCVCDPDFVAEIAAPIDPESGVVMVAGVMRDTDDPQLIDTAGMELDPVLLVYDHLNGEPLEVAGTRADPIGPSAAAAAFDRDSFLAVGGFDERLFAYWEDVDLVLRLLNEGGRCVLAPKAVGTHEHSATLGSGSAGKNYLMGFGRGYVLRKWSIVNARRFFPVLARELTIVIGQAVIDRNLAGLKGRVNGWRAATLRESFPADIAARGGGDPFFRNLARRLRRRSRLAKR